MTKQLLSCVVFAGLAGGCTGSGQVAYSADVQAPQLVEVTPGVQVIADANEPIFYSDSYYWRNDGGVWYRSRSHTSGWVRIDDAPTRIRSIDRPSMYVHYHGEARTNAQARHDVREERRHLLDRTVRPLGPRRRASARR